MVTCAWCRRELSATARADALFCGRVCRQAAWRLRRRRRRTTAVAEGLRYTFAYADPPYPRRAQRYYQCPEVDHAELIARLQQLAPDGWALSTAADALRDVLPLCPEGIVGRAWAELSRAAAGDASHAGGGDTSPKASADASRAAGDDG